jgi:DNA-binding FadR family transcriptional regulator
MTGLTTTNPAAIAETLEARYVEAGAEPGTKLPSERELATRLGVSRPVVREALRILIERGLIEVAPGRGAFVRAPLPSDVARPFQALYRRGQATTRDLIEARIVLESEAAGLAAERATAADTDELERVIGELDAERGLVALARLDLAFHTLVSRAAGNPVLEQMFRSISGLIFEHMLRSYADPTIGQEANPYHRLVAAAIRDRDPATARRAMRDHLAVAARRYGVDLDLGVELLARRELGRVLGPSAPLDEVLRTG